MARIQQFGKYVLTGRLAVGGMAEVFRAKLLGEAGFERVVALKRILPHLNEDEQFIRMFIDEARIAGRLSHGNIVQTLELGRFEGTYYIAMELVEGMDLFTFIAACQQRKIRPPVALTCFVIAEAARALAYAHSARDEKGNPLGIIHRDISPQNLLLSVNGDVKLTDFGIAKALDRAASTAAGVVKGKGGYMPPEQFDGADIDGRADIYALGVVFYEMLTLEHLHAFPVTHDYSKRLRMAPPPLPSLINKECSSVVDGLVQRAVAPDPAKRYADAGVFERQVMRYLHGEAGGYSQGDVARFVREKLSGVTAEPADVAVPRTMFHSSIVGRMEVLFEKDGGRNPRSTRAPGGATKPLRAPSLPPTVDRDAVPDDTQMSPPPRKPNIPAARSRGPEDTLGRPPTPPAVAARPGGKPGAAKAPGKPAGPAKKDSSPTLMLDPKEAQRVARSNPRAFLEEAATSLSTPEEAAAVRKALARTRLDGQILSDDDPLDEPLPGDAIPESDRTVLGGPEFMDELREGLARDAAASSEDEDDGDAFAPETGVRGRPKGLDEALESGDDAEREDPTRDPVIAAILAADDEDDGEEESSFQDHAPGRSVKETADDMWGPVMTDAEDGGGRSSTANFREDQAADPEDEAVMTMMMEAPSLEDIVSQEVALHHAREQEEEPPAAGFSPHTDESTPPEGNPAPPPSDGVEDEPEFLSGVSAMPKLPELSEEDEPDFLDEPEPPVPAPPPPVAPTRRPTMKMAQQPPLPPPPPPPRLTATLRAAPPVEKPAEPPPPSEPEPSLEELLDAPMEPVPELPEVLKPAAITPPIRTHKVGSAAGKLLLAVPAGAKVLVEKVSAGEGPVLLVGMDPGGKLPVEVSVPGYTTWRSMVSLGGKATGQVKVELKRA